jgi:hypothetical protein
MFNETLKPSSKPTTTSIGTFLDMPMTKIEMLLSQSQDPYHYCQQIGS